VEVLTEGGLGVRTKVSMEVLVGSKPCSSRVEQRNVGGVDRGAGGGVRPFEGGGWVCFTVSNFFVS